MFRNWIVFVCLLAAAIGASASQTHGPWTVESVLSELDSHTHDFKSLTANIERTKVTVVANDRSTETGTIAVEGDKMRLDLKQPDVRTILRNGDNFYIYTPGSSAWKNTIWASGAASWNSSCSLVLAHQEKNWSGDIRSLSRENQW